MFVDGLDGIGRHSLVRRSVDFDGNDVWLDIGGGKRLLIAKLNIFSVKWVLLVF